MTDYILYGLIGPDGVIRYVGQTCRKLSYRLREHRKSAIDQPTKGSGIAVREWIQDTGPENVDAVIIAVFDSAEKLDRAEREEVAHRQRLGEPLLNKYDGGLKSGPKKWKICRAGLHELSGDNVAKSANGTRRCRACLRVKQSARWQERKKEYRNKRQKAAYAGVPYIDPRSPLQDEIVMIKILARRNLGWIIKDIAKKFDLAPHLVSSVVKRYHVVDGNLIYRGSRRSLQVKEVHNE